MNEILKKLREESAKMHEAMRAVISEFDETKDLSALEDAFDSVLKELSLDEQSSIVRGAYYDENPNDDFWVKEVYSDKIIVYKDNSLYSIPYSRGEENGISFGEGTEVEVQYRPKSLALQIKSIDDKQMTVAGYGVVFGGEDLEGDTFTKDTDFWFDRITDSPMVMYDHGQDGEIKRTVIGRVGNKRIDNVGLWVESQIEKSNSYFEAIHELVDSGRLGYSSGAVSHLVERTSDRKIVSWPIVEFSLTATPAEPRTLGVEALKSLAETEPAYKALIPEEEAEKNKDSESADGTERERKLREAKLRQHLINLEMED